MDPGDLALLIPIIAVSIPILAVWTRHRQRIVEMQLQSTAHLSAEKAAQNMTDWHALEERVRVLERIVTAEGYDVGRQIEALREGYGVAAASPPRRSTDGQTPNIAIGG